MPRWPEPVRVDLARIDEPGVRELLAELSETLIQITGDSGAQSFALDDLEQDGACLAVARDDSGVLWGCGVLRPLGAEEGGAVVELKRMFARAGSRGVGNAVLSFLEIEAQRRHYRVIRLSTRQVNQRAVRFYTQQGYLPCAPWGRYVGREASVCMEKRLQRST